MQKNVFGLLLIGAIAFGFYAYDFQRSDAKASQPEIGRYEIKDTDMGVFLLDTVTGKNWRRVVIQGDKGEFLSNYWSFEMRFNDTESEARYVDLLAQRSQSEKK